MIYGEQALISNAASKVSDVVDAVTRESESLAAAVQRGLFVPAEALS
jgi:hypothetical protein